MSQPSQRDELYSTILSRRSVRRYDGNPLDAATLTKVRALASDARALVPENLVSFLLRDTAPGSDLAAIVGAYGRLVSPPHYLAPYLAQGRHALTDLGFRTEQIAIGLERLGLGSCYVGALRNEASASAALGLPENALIGAILALGRPARAAGGRALNSLMRSMARSDSRKPWEQLFFWDDFDRPAPSPAEIQLLVEAGRRAPSARNVQPWRFLWRGGSLSLFVARGLYGGGASERYCLSDGGICMANISLAMEALGIKGAWALYEDGDADIPGHPDGLHPLARLELDARRGA